MTRVFSMTTSGARTEIEPWTSSPLIVLPFSETTRSPSCRVSFVPGGTPVVVLEVFVGFVLGDSMIGAGVIAEGEGEAVAEGVVAGVGSAVGVLAASGVSLGCGIVAAAAGGAKRV